MTAQCLLDFSSVVYGLVHNLTHTHTHTHTHHVMYFVRSRSRSIQLLLAIPTRIHARRRVHVVLLEDVRVVASFHERVAHPPRRPGLDVSDSNCSQFFALPRACALSRVSVFQCTGAYVLDCRYVAVKTGHSESATFPPGCFMTLATSDARHLGSGARDVPAAIGRQGLWRQ